MNNDTEKIFLSNSLQEFEARDVNEPVTCEINLDDVEDFANVCRTCAAVTEFVVPIFMGEGLQNNLADKIHKYLPIQVLEDDVLPQVVCYQCVSTLISWDDLVQCCMQADTALKTRLTTLLAKEKNKNNDGKSYKIQTKGKWTPSSANFADGTYRSRIVYETEILDDSNKDHKFDALSASGKTVDTDDESENDDRPLAAIANKKSNDMYHNFYKALLNFRNHYVTEHEINKGDYVESSDSSDSEEILEDKRSEGGDGYEDMNKFDDLTEWNMRKGKMDEETRLELNDVQRKINGKIFFACKTCDKNLSTVHTYIFHKRIHTGERPCVCHVCGKQFRTPNGLQRHLTETHQRLRRHSCSFCPKNFANTQNLKQHLRIHTGERPFVCSHCGKRFTQSGSLHVHLKTHSEQYPFQCAECGAKFRLRSGLTRHRLKHTGERPHVCVHCGKGFRQKHDLYSHALVHTNPKPHACVVCSTAFRQRRALKHHYKRVHQSEPPKEVVNDSVFINVGQYQFKVTAEFVGQSFDKDTNKICEYCGVKQSGEDYPEHLITMHSEQLLPSRERDPFQYVISDDDDEDEEEEEPARKPKKAKPAQKPKKKELSKKPKKTEPAKKSKNTEPAEKPKKAEPAKKRKANNDGNCSSVSTTKSKSCNKKQTEQKPKKNPTSSKVTANQNKAMKNFENQQDKKLSPPAPDVSEALAPPAPNVGEAPAPPAPNVGEDLDTPLQINGPSKQNDNIEIFIDCVEKLKLKKKKKIRRCEICSRVFTAPSSYSYHVRNSHKTQEFECDVCGKKFRNKQTLAQHSVIHDKRRGMECKYCLKRFRSKANLYTHEQIHLDLKKWHCSECSRAFRWRTHLMRHMKRHSAEKPLVCLTCGRRFNVPCDLRRHQRTHTIGHYICHTCDHRFSQLRYLRVHMLKKHNEAIHGN